MSHRWADSFAKLATLRGLRPVTIRRQNGWLETASFGGKVCFTKSATLMTRPREYFVGVDPNKLHDSGDLVLLCGGAGAALRDIFLIPWHSFFLALDKAEPINTYKDRVYLQYKCHVRERNGEWAVDFQGGEKPVLPVSQWRLDPEAAIAALAP